MQANATCWVVHGRYIEVEAPALAGILADEQAASSAQTLDRRAFAVARNCAMQRKLDRGNRHHAEVGSGG